MLERIAILRMGEFLLVSIQVDMHDRLATRLQDELAHEIVRTRARGVLIDVSALDTLDSFIARALANIALTSSLLDAETVLVGIQPAVAITLVEMGVQLEGLRTALNVDRGMDMLREALAETASSAGELDEA